MKEGCWIVAATGHYEYVDDHAHWIQVPEHAELMGLRGDVLQKIGLIKWDFNGPGRRAILLAAMAHGLIRARGHGSSVTFEFTVPVQEAIQAAVPFLTDVAGPHTYSSFTNLNAHEAVGFCWKDHPKSRS
jgi:hypothetical protein